MKVSFAALAAIATNSQMPEVQAGLFGGMSMEQKLAKQKDDTMWYAAGLKGYYTGFYKSFYKQEMPANAAKCLNEETINNILDV